MQAQLSPFFWQPLSVSCAGAAVFKDLAAVSRKLCSCCPLHFRWQPLSESYAYALVNNFVAAAFEDLCRSSPHYFCRSRCPKATQARLSPCFWQTFPQTAKAQTAQAQRSPIRWQPCSRIGIIVRRFWSGCGNCRWISIQFIRCIIFSKNITFRKTEYH